MARRVPSLSNAPGRSKSPCSRPTSSRTSRAISPGSPLPSSVSVPTSGAVTILSRARSGAQRSTAAWQRLPGCGRRPESGSPRARRVTETDYVAFHGPVEGEAPFQPLGKDAVEEYDWAALTNSDWRFDGSASSASRKSAGSLAPFSTSR